MDLAGYRSVNAKKKKSQPYITDLFQSAATFNNLNLKCSREQQRSPKFHSDTTCLHRKLGIGFTVNT